MTDIQYEGFGQTRAISYDGTDVMAGAPSTDDIADEAGAAYLNQVSSVTLTAGGTMNGVRDTVIEGRTPNPSETFPNVDL
jgi:hypothetical protein